MSQRTEQVQFVDDILKFVAFARASGFDVTFGEAWRTPEQQAIYVKTGRSKTMESQHLVRLAMDFNFFVDGKLVQTHAELAGLGAYWESLSPNNRWGGSWRGLVESGKSRFVDLPHFERKV